MEMSTYVIRQTCKDPLVWTQLAILLSKMMIDARQSMLRFTNMHHLLLLLGTRIPLVSCIRVTSADDEKPSSALAICEDIRR
jgi:hypothetical protein